MKAPVDLTTGEIRLTLNPRNYTADAADVTWNAAAFDIIDSLVIYGERYVRDWRFLWLRRRRETVIVDYRILEAS